MKSYPDTIEKQGEFIYALPVPPHFTSTLLPGAEFLFRSPLGFLISNEERKNALCKENAPCIFSAFSVHFYRILGLL